MKSDNPARLAIQTNLGKDPNWINGKFSVNNRWIFSDRPIVTVYRENSSERDNVEIYSTTMHELSHASHWRHNQSRFVNTDDQVLESFARGVEWILTFDAYPNYTGPVYFGQSSTSVVQDLIDGYGLK